VKKTIKNMAVVIIDVQNDFCSDKGITSNSGRNVKNIQAAVNNISRLLDNLRKLNTKIIFFKLIYDPKKIPLSHMQRMKIKKTKNLCQPNSKGIEFYNLKPLKNDKVMEKKGFNAAAIATLNDFEGFDELRHEELGLEEFTDGSALKLI